MSSPSRTRSSSASSVYYDCEQYPPTPPLLAIAPELRLKIYDALFNHLLLEEPRHCWSAPLDHSRFKPLVSLLLAHRQFNHEAAPHFRQYFSSRAIFYFEDWEKFHTFHTSFSTRSILSNARFNLRCGSQLSEQRSREIMMFVLEQPWVGALWHRLEWFNSDGATFGFPSLGNPPLDYSDEELEEQGFEFNLFRMNKEWSLFSSPTLDMIEFPIAEPWRKNTQLKMWIKESAWPASDQGAGGVAVGNRLMGSLELEGRLQDADFTGFLSRSQSRVVDTEG